MYKHFTERAERVREGEVVMIHVIMNQNWRQQYTLMFSSI